MFGGSLDSRRPLTGSSNRPAISGPPPDSDIFGADYCKKLLWCKKGVTGHAAFTRST